ncbi:solute carrier family 2, facilitated glucose transporter member 12 isoform X1 [Mobula birostris]|uniref:solute carrier family 2, facilitated glucose transporter member 12 isoform X1 n=1 Tax=Mobula birostris TaxID=1983395 RepID=UPI003B286524
MELELELENENKSTEIQDDFSFTRLNQPTTTKGPFSFLLIAASITASVSGLIFGYELTNISGALLQLDTDFNLTCVQQEILVSSVLIGGVIGSFAGGYIIDRWERRIGIIVTSLCFIVGNIIMSSSSSYMILVLGRIIVGVAITSSVFSACVYLSEIAPPEKRGMVVSLIEFMIVIGVLFAYIINYSFSSFSEGWRWMFAINLIPAVLQIIGMFFVPPSPRFMIRKGYDEKASLILQKIRSYSNVDNELTAIKSSLSNESNYTYCDVFRAKNNMRLRVGIGFGLVFFLQASGQPNVLYYASTILRSVGFASNTTATLASVSVGVVKVLGTPLAMLLLDRVGRKIFLYIGSATMIVMLTILAVVVHKIPVQFTDVCKYPNHTDHWQDNVTSTIPGYNSTMVRAFAEQVTSLENGSDSIANQSNMGNTTMPYQSSSPFTGSSKKNGNGKEQVSPLLKWLSLACLLLYVAAFSTSFGPVVWVLLSEIFPIGIKGRATSFIGFLNWAFNLLIALTFLSVTESIGLMWMLLMYAILSFAGLIFIFFFIPETKNQTLEEISEQLSQGYNITGACCTMEGVKKLIPERLRKRKGGENSIWATDIEYHTDGLENYFGDGSL